MMSLALSVFIIAATVIPVSAYVGMYIWFYRLNSRFRRHSAVVREELAKQATLTEAKPRAIFIGFFHPYWYMP